MNQYRRATLMRRFHLTMTAAWASLAIPTVILWHSSILWVAFMSLYANMIGHWSAYQAVRAEKEAESTP